MKKKNKSSKSYFIHPNPATFETFQHQFFSLPSPLIYFISNDPCSAKGFSKLQKTCKYFFDKNKIIVADGSFASFDDSIYCFARKKIYFKNKVKFWLCGSLEHKYFCKNIFRFSLISLTIQNQILMLDEMNILFGDGKIKELKILNVEIKDNAENGNGNVVVSCDRILSKVPNIKKFIYECENEIFTTQTFKNMTSLKFNFKFEFFMISKFTYFTLNLDFQPLCEFIKKNAKQYSGFRFNFKNENSNLYRAKLNTAFKKLNHSLQAPDRYPIASIF